MISTRRHPKALPFLFLTEMWERFGFYVVEGMLILYLTKGFGFTDNKSYTILGVFSALAYIAPMAGGFIADRVLGFKQAIAWGGSLLCLGYLFLGMADQSQFYYALAIIVVGNGLFKPNISSLLGALYPPGDTARDAGFTLFYMGINIGVLLAGVGSGYIKNYFGWHAGFLLAGIGLIIGLMIFATGIKIGIINYRSNIIKMRFMTRPLLLLYCILLVPLLAVIMRSDWLAKWLLPTVGIMLLFFMFYLIYQQKPADRKRLITLTVLIISSIIFWMLFLQVFFSTNLFIERLVNKTFYGFSIPTTVFYTFEPIFIIILAPIFAWVWQLLNQYESNPPTFTKFIFAIIFVAIAFFTLVMSTYFTDINNFVGPYWIVSAYFFLTVGELLLSPIGLSAVTFLSPPHLTGMMMGIWFVALGFGGEFAGMLAKISSVPNTQDMVAGLLVYRHAFMFYAFLALGVAGLLIIVQFLFSNSLQG